MKFLERYYNNFCIRDTCFSSHRPLRLIVVIPCYDESFEVIKLCLDSLERAAAAYQQELAVWLLVNDREDSSDSIKQNSLQLTEQLKHLRFSFDFQVCYESFRGKQIGVGYARKYLMDAAFLHFYERGQEGLIINLDADTTVDTNYFNAISHFFADSNSPEAASIAFAHRFVSGSLQNKLAATLYELHLRYFINMQRWIALPFAFQTIGSAMAVKTWAYAKEGGMPKRQAGEDFYFLHKYSKKAELGEINTTCVHPSDRTSSRVPFGTGKAVMDIIRQDEEYSSYNPQSFEILNLILNSIFKFYMEGIDFHKLALDIPQSADAYLKQSKAYEKLLEIKAHTNGIQNFEKRFYNWFDAFRLMKYLHFMRDNHLPNCSIEQGLSYLMPLLGLEYSGNQEIDLEVMRSFDRDSSFYDQCKAGLISRASRISASFTTHQARRE